MKISFKNSNSSEFFDTLKKRVDYYFIVNKYEKQGGWRMVLKTLFIVAVLFSAYAILISNSISSGWIALIVCAILGVFTAFAGFNMAHDGAHGAYSSNAFVNTLMAYSFDFLGCSSYMWKINHNIIHHTYTNIPDHDNDLEPVFFIRLNPVKKIYKIHRFQHWYATFFYGLTSLSWVFKKDFSALLKKSAMTNQNTKHAPKDLWILFIAKGFYYFVFLALPLMVLHFQWYQIVYGFLIMHFFEGLTLALVFQLAHVVENTTFPEPNAQNTIQNNWALHQLATTSDFAKNSKLAAFFLGGLNFQVAHHLFPKICHIHYPAISKILEKTAKDYGLQYNSYGTMWGALCSHYVMLKTLGRV